MDIKHLKSFMAVAECLSFTEAARQLYVAQSAVSQQIAELEKELSVRLFMRNKRTVKLTSAGEVLLKEAVFILSRLDEAVNKTKLAHSGLIGHLRIGFLGYTEKLFLPSMVRRFRRFYPQIELHLEQYHHGDLIEMLSSQELDIGFTLAFGIESVDALERKVVHQETIAMVMPATHPLVDDPSLRLSDVASDPFIVLNRRVSPQGYQQTLQICSRSGFTPNIVHEPRLMQTVLMLVDAEMGVAILPESAKNHASPRLRFIPLGEPESAYQLVVTWNKHSQNPSVGIFLDELEKQTFDPMTDLSTGSNGSVDRNRNNV